MEYPKIPDDQSYGWQVLAWSLLTLTWLLLPPLLYIIFIDGPGNATRDSVLLLTLLIISTVACFRMARTISHTQNNQDILRANRARYDDPAEENTSSRANTNTSQNVITLFPMRK